MFDLEIKFKKKKSETNFKQKKNHFKLSVEGERNPQ